MSLAARDTREEAMDAPDLPAETYRAVLSDLARVNRVTMASRSTLGFLDRAARGRERLRILDVGFGQGDILRRIAAWAAKRRIAADLVGIDLNPRSAPIATAATPGGGIDYRTGDYRDLDAERWDVVLSSLVAHHMGEGELTDFLRFMERHARVGWLVNDLHRHRLAYAGYPLLARLMRWHPIVRADGRLSIARAFRPAEWRGILATADIADARIVRHFPFRLCVERLR